MTESHEDALLKFRELLLTDTVRAIGYYNNSEYETMKPINRIPAALMAQNLQRLDITLNSIGIEVETPWDVTNVISELIGDGMGLK